MKTIFLLDYVDDTGKVIGHRNLIAASFDTDALKEQATYWAKATRLPVSDLVWQKDNDDPDDPSLFANIADQVWFEIYRIPYIDARPQAD